MTKIRSNKENSVGQQRSTPVSHSTFFRRWFLTLGSIVGHFFVSNSSQPSGLISVLLNPAAEFGDRDDAAMDLGSFDDDAAEEALIAVIANPEEDEDIIDSAAESLNEIWNRKSKRDERLISKMHSVAKRHFE